MGKSFQELVAHYAQENSKRKQQEKRNRAFLAELTELTRKHGVQIVGCGCCGSPGLTETRTPGAYTEIDGDYVSYTDLEEVQALVKHDDGAPVVRVGEGKYASVYDVASGARSAPDDEGRAAIAYVELERAGLLGE